MDGPLVITLKCHYVAEPRDFFDRLQNMVIQVLHAVEIFHLSSLKIGYLD